MSGLHIDDLFDHQDLIDAVRDGHVRKQVSDDGFTIFNYTELTVHAKAWTPVTLTCRGLIVDADGKVIARPFPKFFNYGQAETGWLDMSARVEVTDKADGSLGILFWDAVGQPRIATRGSFASDQALHATDLFLSRYWSRERLLPERGVTYLFEVVYPANRIVLNYGSRDDLILLGCVDIATGRIYGPESAPCRWWPGPRTAVFSYRTLAEALAAEPRPNAEGLVVRYVDGPARDRMVKIKQADYVALHAIATKTSTTTVWESLMSGRPLVESRELVPDELLAWVDQWSDKLTAAKEAHVAAARAAFAAMPVGVDRKSFAQLALASPYRAELFRLLDDKEIDSMAWKAVRPAWEPARLISEDAA